MPDWWLDELAHAGPEHLDAESVARYDAKAQYDPTADVDALVAHGLDAEATVVDLGAGTGTFAIAAARVAGRVIAVDVSPAMVAVLQQRTAGRDNVTVVHAGFLSYVHDGAPPQFVVTRNALHQLPDFWKAVALSRIAALLPPGGILRVRDLVYDVEPADVETFVPQWFAGAVTDPRRGYTPDDLAEHVRTEFSTYRWLFEPMLDRTGFEVLDAQYVRDAYAAYTCRRR
jgi:SAM-dependent methyltransferase